MTITLMIYKVVFEEVTEAVETSICNDATSSDISTS